MKQEKFKLSKLMEGADRKTVSRCEHKGNGAVDQFRLDKLKARVVKRMIRAHGADNVVFRVLKGGVLKGRLCPKPKEEVSVTADGQ